jgi:hypothetical protein
MRFEDRLIPGADLVRKAQLPVAAAAQKREGQGTALAADRDRSGLADDRREAAVRIVEHRTEGRDERPQRVDDAFGVRTADKHAKALGDRTQFAVTGASRLVALFGKSRADHDRGAYSSLAALRKRVGDMRGRHQDHRKIGRLG